jgi:prolyl oligopeptidase
MTGMRRLFAGLCSLVTVISLSGCAVATDTTTVERASVDGTQEEINVQNIVRPPDTRIEVVDDTLHGHVIADPYRWLEGTTDEVGEWTDAQNAYASAWLGKVPGREAIHQRLDELLEIGYITTPEVRGTERFYQKRDGDQNQPVLYVRSGDADAKPLVDPNQFADITTAMNWSNASRDGSLLAYGISQSGTEQTTLHLINVATGEALADTIPNTRACSVAWLKDNSGFYYTRYPQSGEVPEGDENYNRHVYFHHLGADWQDDPIVFGDGRAKENWPVVTLSDNDRWLIVMDFVTFTRSEVYALERESGEWRTIVDDQEAKFWGGAVDDTLFVITDWEASRFRILSTTLGESGKTQWREIVPERESILEDFAFAGEHLLVQGMEKASSRLELFSRTGEKIRDVELPTLGTVHGIDGQADNPTASFVFSSFFVPPVAYTLDVETGEMVVFDEIKTGIDRSRFSMEQVWYESKDGTPVSMFLVHGADLKRDGTNPTLLSGYGGFSNSETPVFQRNTFLWLERGGVFAVANLRGGGEYGEGWHRAGMLGNKQNTYDDFIAAGEWLVKQGYTNTERLAVRGGSNGGLLVGAVVTQRPDLFRAAVADVPLLDMLRYHEFLIARLWIPEYGDPADPEHFKWLYAYSPYHRVVDGTAYPAVLMTAGESDSRVHPLHARKMAAALQSATTSGYPILVRVERSAGHGQGKPRSSVVDELTDMWCFVLSELGMATE